MVAIYCSHCVIVFPSIRALHEHIKGQVPDGSYTFDFKSQTGYPNENQFPYVSLTKCRKTKKFKDLTKKRKSTRRTGKTAKLINENKTSFPNLRVKEEADIDKIIAEDEVSYTNLTDPVIEIHNDHDSNADFCENLQTDDIHNHHNKNDAQDYIDNDFANDNDNDNYDDDDDNDYDNNVENKDNYDDNYDDENGNIDRSSDEGEGTGILDGVVNEKDKEKSGNEVESEAENIGNQGSKRKCRKGTETTESKDPRTKWKLKELGFQFNYKGKKKYLLCEVCGTEKEQYKLVDHIESAHSDAMLSQTLLQKLHELRSILQKRITKKVRKVKKEEDDSEYVPSEEEEDGKVKKTRRKKQKLGPNIRDGVKKHTSKKKTFIECTLCGIFVQNARIKRHERFHGTKAGKKMFQPENLTNCDTCDRRVLKTHVNKHKCFLIKPKIEIEKPNEEERLVIKKEKKKMYQRERIPCHICGLLVKRNIIKNHVLYHSDTMPFQCDLCNKGYVTKGKLRKHVEEAHGERIHQCDKCPKSFRMKERLKDHLVTHSNERPHVCQTCGHAFRRKKALVCHLYVHSDLPGFACCHCGKKFNRKTNMQSHVKSVHGHERSWICSWPDCKKLFFTSAVLKRHMLIHSGEKPEKCSLCDASFTQRPELKYHLKRKHNTDEMPPPSFSTPYSGLSYAIINNPFSIDDKEAMKLKTFFFPSMTKNPFEKLVIEIKESPFTNQGASTLAALRNGDTAKHSLNQDTSMSSVLPEENEELTNPVETSTPIEDNVKHSTSQEQTDSIKLSSNLREDKPEGLELQIHSEQVPIIMETEYATSSQSATLITSEEMFINCELLQKKSPYSAPSLEIEDVSRMATSTALEAMHFDEADRNNPMTESTTAEYQQLLSNPDVPVTSIMKIEPELGTSEGNIWAPFQ